MGNKLTNLFNLSFEDSKKIMFKRWGIQDHTFSSNYLRYRDSNSKFPSRLFATAVFIGFLMIALGSGKGFGELDDGDAKFINYSTQQLISKLFHMIDGIIWGVAIIMGICLFIYLVVPPRNFGWYRLEMFNLMFILSVIMLFAYLAPLTGLILGMAGEILGGITLVCLGIFLPFSLFKDIRDLQHKVNGKNNFTKEYKNYLFLLATLIGIVLIIGLIRTNLMNTLLALFFIIVYLVVVFGFKYFINCFFNYYYMLKYSTEYRKYYRIPDAAWYLSNRRAKKHPHVYTIGDELKEKE